ncbi:aldo/keto reductase [Litoricola sp.]|nr:aldo/keto reductase [Litorivicinus sp.]
MQYRLIPQAPIELSAVGIGAMSFADFYGPVTEDQAHAILDKARHVGINHIDTANIYGRGNSETFIGHYLQAHPGAREEFFIATKAGIGSNPETKERIFSNEPGYLRRELEKSLGRLGTDYVDLFYIHRRDREHLIEQVMETLMGFQEEGLIQHIGLSEIAPTTLERAWSVGPVAAVQSEYSLATRAPELGLLSRCERLGTTFVAFSPVGRSLLTDKPRLAHEIPNLQFLKTNPRFLSPNLELNIEAVDPLREYAKSLGKTTAQLAVSWVLSKSQNIITIPGTRSVDHLEAHIRAANEPLTAQQIQQCEEILEVGWCHGDRYSDANWIGPEKYC